MYVKRSRVKGVKLDFSCSREEEKYIRLCAKEKGMSLSRYMRAIAVQGLKTRDTPLPTEVLVFQGELCQVAGLLEIIAQKRQDGDELNALERAQLKELRNNLVNMSRGLKKLFL